MLVCTLNKERLGYVITVPLVRKKTFTVLRMIPIPVPVNRDHFIQVFETLRYVWTELGTVTLP